MHIKKIYVLLFFVLVVLTALLIRPTKKDLAKMYDISGDTTKAEKLLEDILEKHPEDKEATKRLSRIYLSKGRNKEALVLLRSLTELEPDSIEHRRRLITFYYDNMMREEMITERESLVDLVEKQKELPDREKTLGKEYKELADIYSSHQLIDKQLGITEKRYKLEPGNKKIVEDYLSLLTTKKRIQEVLQLMDEVIDDYPNEPWMIETAIGAAFLKKEFAKAERYADVAIQTNPEKPVYWIYLLNALKPQSGNKEKFNKSLRVGLKAWDKFGEEFPLYDVIASAIERKEFTFARKAIDRWIKKRPDLYTPWPLLIYRFSEATQMPDKERLDLYKKAIALFSENKQLIKDGAFFAQKEKDWKYAASLWKQLLQGTPENYKLSQNYLFCLSNFDKKSYETQLDAAIKRFSGTTELLEQKANFFLNAKRWKEAGKIWNQLVKAAPEKLNYRRNLLYCLSKQGAEKKYKNELLRAVYAFPEDQALALDALYLLIRKKDKNGLAKISEFMEQKQNLSVKGYRALIYAYELQKKDEKAFELARRGVRSHAESPELLKKIFFLASQKAERLDEAISIYKRMLAKNPKNREALIGLRNTSLRMGSPQNAIAAAKRLKELEPESIPNQEALIKLYEETMQMDKAIKERESLAKVLEKKQSHPNIATRLIVEYRRLVNFYKDRQDTDAELHVLRKLITLRPEVKVQRVEFLQALSRDSEDFYTEIELAIQDFPGDSTLLEMSIAYAFQMGHFKRAERYAESAVRANPKKQSFWSYLILALKRQPQTDIVVKKLLAKTFEASEQLGEKFKVEDALNFLKEAGKIEVARRSIEKWIDRYPTDWKSWEALIYDYAKIAQLSNKARFHMFQEALKQFPKARKLKNDFAYICYQVGRWDVATKLWKEFIREEPNNPEYVRNLLYCLTRTESFKKYRRQLYLANAKFPKDLEFKRQLATTLQDNKVWHAAADLWKQIIRKNVKELNAYQSLLYCLSQGGDKDNFLKYLDKALKQFPNNQEFLTTLANRFQSSKQWGPASQQWKKLLEIDPKNLGYHQNLLFCLSKLPDRNAYLTAMKASLDMLSGNKDFLLNAAYLSQDLKEWPTSAKLWSQLVNLHPKNLDYRKNLLFSLSHQGEEEKYRQELWSALTTFPKQSSFTIEGIYFYINKKQVKQLALLIGILEKGPKPPFDVQLAMVDAYQTLNQPDKAHRLIQEISAMKPEDEAVLKQAANIYASLKDWDQAISCTQKLLAKNPDEKVYIQMHQSYLWEAKRWDELLPFLENVVKNDPNNKDALLTMAYHYSDNGMKEEAIPIYEKLLKLEPKNKDFLVSLIYSYLELKRTEPALKLLESRWETMPHHIETGGLLAELYARTGNLTRAEQVRAELLEQAGSDPRALQELGRRLLSLNAIEEAEIAYSRLLEIEPSNPSALRGLGRVKAWNNAPKQAKRMFEKYLVLVPDDATIHVALGKILRLFESFDAANKEFEAAINILDRGGKADSPVVLRAFALAGMERIEEAIPYFEALIQKNPKDGYLWGDYAEALVENELYDKAMALLKNAPSKGIYFRRNERLKARIYFETREYHQAALVMKDLYDRFPNDLGIMKELASFSEVLERWADALHLYEQVWEKEAELVDSRTDSANRSIALMKEHNPQLHLMTQTIESGNDNRFFERLFYNYPFTDGSELQGEFFIRDLEGPGLLLNSNDVDETVADMHADVVFRPGYGLKGTVGLLGAFGPERVFGGAKVGLGYRQEDWLTEVTAKWREHWHDPVKVTPFTGAQDSVKWEFSWFQKEWYSVFSALKVGQYYLLDPPTGGGKDVYEFISWDAGAELKIIPTPGIWLTYSFSWLKGDQEPFYAPLVGLQERRATHTVGIRFRHDFGPRLTVFASTGVGHDSVRNISLSGIDLLNHQFGFIWRFSDLLELRGTSFEGTETSQNTNGTFTQNNLNIVMRF